MTDKSQSLKARYEALTTDRQSFLDRARQCSELTLPTLVPPEGHNGSTVYPTPWQSVGARGVNALASKLLTSLFPPNHPFFRLQLDDVAIMKIAGDLAAKAMIEAGLSKYERAVQSEIETNGFRSPIFAAIKHLIVAGNAVLDIPADGAPRVFSIDSYVCLRDGSGNLLDLVIKECLSEDSVPDDIRAMLDEEPGDDEENEPAGQREEVDVYTRYYRDDGVYKEYQEVCGKRVDGSDATYPLDKPGKLVLRWTADPGSDYGRSYVEEYLGDLQSLDSLMQAIVEAANSMAKVIWLVNPNGVTRAKDLSEAENGAFVSGVLNEVICLQAEKQADLRIPADTASKLTTALESAFMLGSSIQRKGERVTAEEIRFMANELESTLGGVFSTLACEFQLPLVRRVIARMNKAKSLPPLPKGIKAPVIITGLDALGRSAELQKLQTMLQILQPFGETVMSRIKIGNLLSRVATAVMIDDEGLFMTDDEIQQQQAAAQQQQQAAMQQQQMGDLAGKAAPAAIKAISEHMANQAPQAGASPDAPPAQ